MTVFKSIITACLMAMLFASCAGDSKEKIMADSKSMIKEMTEIFKSIKDKSTAEAAKPKLEALAKKGKEMEVRLKALNLDKKSMDEETKKDPEMKKLTGELMEAMGVLLANEEVQSVLQETMTGL